MMAVDPFLSIVVAPLLLALSGLVVASATRPVDRAGEEDLPGLLLAGLGWGFAFIPALSFLVFYGLFKLPVTWLTVLGADLLAVGGALAWWGWGHPGSPRPALVPAGVEEALRTHRIGLVAALVVFLLYLVKFDRALFSVGEGCLHRAALAAVGHFQQPINLFADVFADARLGNPAFLGPYLALFQGFGFRLLYAVLGLLMAVGGYVTGVWVGGRWQYGLVGLVLLPLNPYVLKIPLLDENLMTLAVASTCLPFLLRRKAPWATVGLLLSLALGMRHILALAAPAMVLAVWLRTRRWQSVAWFAGAAIVGTIPYHIHHVLAMGSLFRFESFGQLPAYPHDFGFGTVMWEGLLNWPFHSQVVRTPHNSHPTFALWVLWVVDHFGLLLCGIAAAGAVLGFLRDRAAALVRLGIFVPVFLMLACQENWDYVNKMNVLLIVFLPALEWTLVGIRGLVERVRLFLPATAVGVLLVWGAAAGMAAIEAPADARYQERFPVSGYEPAGLLEYQRQVATDFAPWPDYGRAGDFQQFFRMGKLKEVPEHLRNPDLDAKSPFGWSPSEIPDAGPPITVALDLSAPLFGRSDWIRLTDEPPDIDVTDRTEPAVSWPIEVPWTDRPMVVLVAPGNSPVAGVSLLFGYQSAVQDLNYFLSLMALRSGSVGSREEAALPTHDVAGPVVRIRMPSGALNVLVRINRRAYRYLHWKVHTRPDGLDVPRHRWVYHD